jgi:hypothetical protein
METPAKKRYADWYARHRLEAQEYKRNYYATHPQYAELKREKARLRYYEKKSESVLTTKLL